MTTEDIKHLEFIYDRMIHVHGEDKNVDYMIKFREKIDSLREVLSITNNYYTSPSNPDQEFSLFNKWRDDSKPDRDDDDSWSTGTIRHFQD